MLQHLPEVEVLQALLLPEHQQEEMPCQIVQVQFLEIDQLLQATRLAGLKMTITTLLLQLLQEETLIVRP